jgi:DNA repair protein RecN (Recombination protein N)
MLKHIVIRDYAIVDALDIELEGGMTVITGETGAGKSIMLDALGLCVGDRADSRTVRPGAKRAEITAVFTLSDIPSASQWLKERELDDDADECILRRTVTADGRSKAFINGVPATLAETGELGELLVDIHSQHAHQSLLRKSHQRDMLDAFAGASELAQALAETAQQCERLTIEFERLANQNEADTARLELLRYQVNELEELGLQSAEIEILEAEQKQLANAGFLLESAGQAAEGCEVQSEEIRRLRGLMADERHNFAAVANIREMLSSAEIQLDEARSELTRYADGIELDPSRLAEVDQRLEAIYDLARKHRVMPERLFEHHLALNAELEGLDGGDERLDQLRAEIKNARAEYSKLASRLTNQRTKAAVEIADKVSSILSKLAMERCSIKIALTPHAPESYHPRGNEDVEFLISTNPGAEPGPLAKIASGGELSRISLALQVAAAENATVPTMIFDEVDVGIGGAVAEVVGDLLHHLSARVQVLCVTHLPQVAAKGDQHLQVSKAGDKNSVSTTLATLDTQSRISEIARMLGGMKITESTLAHAREMLTGG